MGRASLCIRTVIIMALFTAMAHTAWGQEIDEVTLKNRTSGITMSVINYGARIKSLCVGGKDVVLGFDRKDDYTAHRQNLGAVVGRYIGRILGGKLSIDGHDYQLQTGGNGDCSHGGSPGFAQKLWTITSLNDSAVAMRYISCDGENGFPGELTLVVRYTLESDALRIDYSATTTKPTVLNPSNHSFFNLSGCHSMDILDEELWIDATEIAAYDKNKRVTGEMMSVAGTPFDFTRPTRIGLRIDNDDAQLRVTKGYDHCYRLNTRGRLDTPAARITDSHSGLVMEVYTTEPAMQIYTANGHNGSLIGKGGIPYNRRNAICFETMHFPDSPNKPQWPSTLLRPGETFKSTTIYRFTNTQGKSK
ncbi:MAG: aldose epimerase family protein [Prevotella sp.]